MVAAAQAELVGVCAVLDPWRRRRGRATQGQSLGGDRRVAGAIEVSQSALKLERRTVPLGW